MLNRTVPADFGGYSGIGVDSAVSCANFAACGKPRLALGMLDVMRPSSRALVPYPIALGGIAWSWPAPYWPT
ncbi:MAG: hypothetical protein R3F17_02290 [Planctomycetota bacterium]